MKRYKKILGKMYETDEGEWVTYQAHHTDYISRWKATNAEFKLFYDRQYHDAVLINQLKFAVTAALILLLLEAIF